MTTMSACQSPAANVAVNPPLVIGADTLAVEEVREYLRDAIGFTSQGGRVYCSYAFAGQDPQAAYVLALCEELVPAPGDSLVTGSATRRPIALYVQRVGSTRTLVHRSPRDGDMFNSDLRSIVSPQALAQLRAIHRGWSDVGRQLERANREGAVRPY
jgi:hypothetical protein